MNDREIESISGVSDTTIFQTRFILTAFTQAINKTDAEKDTLKNIQLELESGTKSVDPVYKQFKVAEEVLVSTDTENKTVTEIETLKQIFDSLASGETTVTAAYTQFKVAKFLMENQDRDLIASRDARFKISLFYRIKK